MEKIVSFTDPERTGNIARTAGLFDLIYYIITHDTGEVLDEYPFERVWSIISDYVWQGEYKPVELSVIKRDNDKDLALHMVNTAIYSCMLAERTGEDVFSACATGLFHDIGKKYIPSDILYKPGKLTEDEWKVIEGHPITSKIILDTLYPEFDQDIANAVLFHHEMVSGQGYPYGISEKGLNAYARIVAIADTIDAATAESRTYHRRKSIPEAIAIIKDKYHYDPFLARVMANALSERDPEKLMETM